MLGIRVNGIPLTEGQIEEVHDARGTLPEKLDRHVLEQSIVTLCNGKGTPPLFGTKDSVEFWRYMWEYSRRNFHQAAALWEKSEREAK